MGTALAQIIAANNNAVALWNYDSKLLFEIEKTRKSKFLPGVKLSEHIYPEEDITSAVKYADVVILATASPYIRQMSRLIGPALKSKAIVVSIAKGIDKHGWLPMHEVIAQEIPERNHKRITVLSGPSIADEFVQGIPTAVVAASADPSVFKTLRYFLRTPTFRIATSEDVVGVAMSGVAKNAYSVALGLCDGLKLKMNAKAWLATVALAEMAKFVEAMGGELDTVYGLAGHGDLMVTGFGNSRNRAFGEYMAKCKKNCKATREVKATTEGIDAIKAMRVLAKQKRVKLPLLETMYAIVFRGRKAEPALNDFFKHVRLK